MSNSDLIGTDISGYLITKYINSGSFGSVWEATDKKGNKVALKIPINTKEKNGQRWIIEEARVYKVLNKNSREGITNMKVLKYTPDKSNSQVNVIVMDLLGDSLETVLKKSGKFRLKTVILLAIQMLNVIKYIHECGYIHRDIKPDNFVMGVEDKKDVLYCIDFGLAKKYKDKHDNIIPFKDNLKFCGTARYSSIASHIGHEQSRKDDLEAIGYNLVYLFKNNLPWRGIKHKNKDKRYKLIAESKNNISEEELCKGLPKEFEVYLKYVKNLDYNETPLYRSLIKMFEKLYNQRGYNNETVFD
jgi:serine/threonine protein kinase